MPNPYINRRIVSGGVTQSPPPSPEPLGEIFTDQFARASLGTDYTNSSGAFSTNGTELVAVNGGGGVFDKKLAYTKNGYNTNVEELYQEMTFNAEAVDGFGLGMGISNEAPAGVEIKAVYFLTALPGKIRIYDTAGNVLAQSVAAVAVNANDEFLATFDYNKDLITATLTNITAGGSTSISYTYSLVSPLTVYPPGKYMPILLACGGTQTIQDWTVSSNALKFSDWLLISDSIGKGYFANSLANRYFTQAMATLGKVGTIYSGVNNVSDSFYIPELLTLAPQNALIVIGVNDVAAATPVNTISTNVGLIVTALQGIGCNVKVGLTTPNDTYNMAPLRTKYLADYPTLIGPDFYTLLKGGGTAYAPGNSPDGTHPADTVQTAMSTEFITTI